MYAFFSSGNKDVLKVLNKILAAVIAVFWAAFLGGFAYIGLEKKLVYPLTYQDEIFTAAEKYDLDAALLFSVARVESSFKPYAVSVRGAKGLMQILPSTGDYIAAKKGITDYDLFDVQTNVDFGAYYLKYLYGRFKEFTETAAAYNAGEGTVGGWLKNPEYSTDGIHLNKIPYGETERYVKKIYESLKRYRKLYGKLLDKKKKFG